MLLGGRDQLHSETDSIQSFVINDMLTTELGCLPKPLIGFATTNVTNRKGTFVVAGGVSNQEHQKQCYLFSQSEDGKFNMQPIADMLQEREEFGLVCNPDGKHLYAIGGYNESLQCLSSVERYSFATDTWEKVADLDRPLKALGAVSMPDGIYAIGGFDGVDQKYCADVHKYDISGNTWT